MLSPTYKFATNVVINFIYFKTRSGKGIGASREDVVREQLIEGTRSRERD